LFWVFVPARGLVRLTFRPATFGGAAGGAVATGGG
jgi:hypothetical protein